MQQRAGLLFLSKKTSRIFLILENQKWTVPTFTRCGTLINDAKKLLDTYSSGRLVPIELYLSEDKGFEYGTYVCLVPEEFISYNKDTFSWCDLDSLPKQLHLGLNSTLNNPIIRTKIDTILELENAND